MNMLRGKRSSDRRVTRDKQVMVMSYGPRRQPQPVQEMGWGEHVEASQPSSCKVIR